MVCKRCQYSRVTIPLLIGSTAGLTYCGIGALSLLGKLPGAKFDENALKDKTLVPAEFLEKTIWWLVHRQTSVVQDDSEYNLPETNDDIPSSPPKHDVPSFYVLGATPTAPNIPNPHHAPLNISLNELQRAGFNGRCNKVADTCYSFWAGATLGVLNTRPHPLYLVLINDQTLQKVHLISFNANRRYLLEKTQHVIGGFGKLPGLPPGLSLLSPPLFPRKHSHTSHT